MSSNESDLRKHVETSTDALRSPTSGHPFVLAGRGCSRILAALRARTECFEIKPNNTGQLVAARQ